MGWNGDFAFVVVGYYVSFCSSANKFIGDGIDSDIHRV
jgi:hypothetical protein